MKEDDQVEPLQRETSGYFFRHIFTISKQKVFISFHLLFPHRTRSSKEAHELRRRGKSPRHFTKQASLTLWHLPPLRYK